MPEEPKTYRLWKLVDYKWTWTEQFTADPYDGSDGERGEYREPTELFCPLCGKREVDVQIGEGDYYVGPRHGCRSCLHDFYLR